MQGLGQQQLRVCKQEADSTIENALSQSEAFGLKKDAAVEAVKRVAACVHGWKEFFQKQGVQRNDLEVMAQYIDGPRLQPQRSDFVARQAKGVAR